MGINKTCKQCGGFCPSGTLANGLCSDCDITGQTVLVNWGMHGARRAVVTKITKHGNIYAKRYMKTVKRWSNPQRIEEINGAYYRT